MISASEFVRLVPSLRERVTLCALFYGDYPQLAERLLTTLERYTDLSLINLRLGLNSTSAASRVVIDRCTRHWPNVTRYESNINLWKSGMMRRLFHDPEIGTSWTIWLDDDTYFNRPDWLLTLGLMIEQQPDVDLWGRVYRVVASNHVQEFIRTASWFRGRSSVQHGGKCILTFPEGGYWAIRTRRIRELDWPDPRLIHFEDDYILGEAIRQWGGRVGECARGVCINAAPRRAPPDTPHKLPLTNPVIERTRHD